ncbi:ABC transporter substrate-binding protein [Pseudomonas sp. NFACC46-3]|uniref:ABC transporter substrate-binding protein n=1 Tax=Pseudomonas sp. NFACC46-3 TaxID=1566200 RepID=UPI000B85BBDB|nr:ABC transporter substrate-binding protein [Pseudomonas sp. NFACC46-3]
MFKFICRLVALLCLSFWLPVHAAGAVSPSAQVRAATSVVFLNPGRSTETFWVSYSEFMQAAANGLGLRLRVEYAERDPERMIRQAQDVITSVDRPDYLVLVNEQYVAPRILQLAQGSGIKLFLVNNTLTSDQTRLLAQQGAPPAELLGSLVPDDERSGYLMLTELLRQHGPLAPGQTLDLLAFSGKKSTPSAQLREKGLYRALAEHPQVHLRQLVYGEWNRERSYEQASQLAKRYPQTALVWSANDEMALGAMQAFEEAGRQPGKDVLFSAMNSSRAALQARIDGRLSVLFTGHFSLGGWAMVLLHDHARGTDLARHGGYNQQIDLMQSLDPARARAWLNMDPAKDYRLDFKRFSLVSRPDGERYAFSLDGLGRR